MADGRGSLIRIQHMAFFGLQCQVEGRTTAFWEVLSRTIRAAQNIGIHCNSVDLREGTDKSDQEVERRTFCNLYIWDSLLYRQLDRIPFLPGRAFPGNWPQLPGDNHIETGVDAPDPFTERILETHLADFWRSVGPAHGTEYDIIAAEERYDQFCREYLSQLPPAFALKNADETWDKRFSKLPLQRKLLHTAIYDSICWNFRPLLLRRPTAMAPYKSVILSLQKRKLAAAALHALDSVTQLHGLLGGCHTRLAGIAFTTFDAAVLLVFLCTDSAFPEDCPPQHIPPPGTLKTDPLQAGICSVTRTGCIHAIVGALKRLRMLAEVSSMAESGANTLVQLLNKAQEANAGTELDSDEVVHISQEIRDTAAVTRTPTTTSAASHLGGSSATTEVPPWLHGELLDPRSMHDFMSMSGSLAVEDVGSWASIDPSIMYSHDMS